MTTYHLTTIKDIYDKVPPDRWDDYLMELGRLFHQTRNLGDLMGVRFELPDPLEWDDDGKGEITTKVMVGEKPILTMTTTLQKEDAA